MGKLQKDKRSPGKLYSSHPRNLAQLLYSFLFKFISSKYQFPYLSFVLLTCSLSFVDSSMLNSMRKKVFSVLSHIVYLRVALEPVGD